MSRPEAAGAHLSPSPFCSVDALIFLSQVLKSLGARDNTSEKSILREETKEGGFFPNAPSADGASVRGGEDMALLSLAHERKGAGDHGEDDFKGSGGEQRWRS